MIKKIIFALFLCWQTISAQYTAPVSACLNSQMADSTNGWNRLWESYTDFLKANGMGVKFKDHLSFLTQVSDGNFKASDSSLQEMQDAYNIVFFNATKGSDYIAPLQSCLDSSNYSVDMYFIDPVLYLFYYSAKEAGKDEVFNNTAALAARYKDESKSWMLTDATYRVSFLCSVMGSYLFAVKP